MKMKPHLFDGHAQLFQHLQALLLVLLARHPEGVSVLHDVSQDRAAEEYHVLATRGVLNTNLELLLSGKEEGKEKATVK